MSDERPHLQISLVQADDAPLNLPTARGATLELPYHGDISALAALTLPNDAQIEGIAQSGGKLKQALQQTLGISADDLAALPESATRLKDAKTQLQEYLQGRGLPLPDYQIISETGPEHAREFQIEATSGDYRATARGNSRKKAEQEAAADLLAQYQSSKHE